MNRIARYITRGTCLLIAATGLIVLTGWIFDIPAFKGALTGITSMKFNTGVCFLLSAISLYLLDKPDPGIKLKKIALAFALFILITGLLSLLEYIFHWNIGFDELLRKDNNGTASTISPGRMSPVTAINFSILGYILLNLKIQNRHYVIQVLLLIMTPGLLLAVFNRLFEKSFLSSLPLLNTMALHTAVLFLLLGIGVYFSSPLQYVQLTFKKKIVLFFSFILFISGILFFEFQKNRQQEERSALLVDHIRKVLATASKFNIDVYEIQKGTNRYLITGDDHYLLQPEDTVNAIYSTINQLRLLIKDNNAQQHRVDTLRRLIDEYITYRKEMVSIRRKNGFGAAQKDFLARDPILMIDNIHSEIAAIVKEENSLLEKQIINNKQAIRNSALIKLLLLIVNVLFLLFSLLFIIKNIRARDKAEEQLKESKEKLSLLFNSIDEGFCIIEMIFDERKKPVDYRFLLINPSFEKQTGLRDAVGKRMREFAPDHEEHWFEIYGKIALTGESIRFENRADQLGRWYDVYAFRYGDPQIHQVAILFNDITERKKSETIKLQLRLELEKRVEEKTREVVEKEQQYRFLLQNMREGIQVISREWKYIFVNNAVIKQSKYSNEELLGHTMMEKYPGIENSPLFKVLQECMMKKTPRIIENEFIFPDGTKEWFELSIQPVPEGLFILSMDITKRKESEKQLIASEIRFRSIIEQFPYPVVTYSPEGTFLNANEAWEHMWQDKRGNIRGYNIRKDPQLKESGLSLLFEKAFTGEVVISSPYLYDPAIAGFSGRPRWIQTTLYPLKSAGGDILEIIHVLQDVSENKEAEEKLKQYAEELKISNTELERFAYVASHDLQEPLRMISSFLNLLEDELGAEISENARVYINYAIDGARRMKVLINDLLQYSRIGIQSEGFTANDLNETINYVTMVLAEDITKSKAVITVKQLPVIAANKTLISQLFMNLLSNALKYRGDNCPEIEIGYTDGPSHYTFFVKDNGIGIDNKYFDKIFIIFQRLHNKNEYSGAGIGLAICKKIVEAHKGKIWVESTRGQGSTFYFTLIKNIK